MPKKFVSPNSVSSFAAISRLFADGFVRAENRTIKGLRFGKNAQNKNPVNQMLRYPALSDSQPLSAAIEVDQQNQMPAGVSNHTSDVIRYEAVQHCAPAASFFEHLDSRENRRIQIQNKPVRDLTISIVFW